jgi:hypothetical protein
MTTATHDWYAILHAGSNPAPSQGPYRGRDEAVKARDSWRERHGCMAGTYETSGSVRIVGPYCTRQAAAKADISDHGKTCQSVHEVTP